MQVQAGGDNSWYDAVTWRQCPVSTDADADRAVTTTTVSRPSLFTLSYMKRRQNATFSLRHLKIYFKPKLHKMTPTSWQIRRVTFLGAIILQMTPSNFTCVCLAILPIIRWFYSYDFLGVLTTDAWRSVSSLFTRNEYNAFMLLVFNC